MQIFDANLTPNLSLAIALAKIMAVFLATIFKDFGDGKRRRLVMTLARCWHDWH